MRALFALLVLALLAMLVWLWWEWPPPAATPGMIEPTASMTKAPSPAVEHPWDLLAPLRDKDEYLVVTERPLFRSDRRPESEEPEEDSAEPSSPTSIDGLDLNAVLITPSESLAWIRDPTNKTLLRLRLGDKVAGWNVQAILSDRVLLVRQGEKDTLVLRDYSTVPPPSAKHTRQATDKRAPRLSLGQQRNRRSVDGNSERDPRRLPTRNPRVRDHASQSQQQP